MLKQNIDNTNELKNKVKLANTRIKETVIRGGGYDFKSLDKAPERIKKMLGAYKKIAILDLNVSCKGDNYDFEETLNIPINLDFNPQKYVIFIEDKSSRRCLSNIQSGYENIYGDDDIRLNYITNNSISIYIKFNNDMYAGKVKVKKILAIG